MATMTSCSCVLRVSATCRGLAAFLASVAAAPSAPPLASCAAQTGLTFAD
jgi:hypothetical protein